MLDPPNNRNMQPQDHINPADNNSNLPSPRDTALARVTQLVPPESSSSGPIPLFSSQRFKTSSVDSSVLASYQHQLMLLEQQGIGKIVMAQEVREAIGGRRNSQEMSGPHPVGPEEQSSVDSSVLASYQHQLILLDQQNKKRELMAQEEQDVMGGRRDSQEMSDAQPVKPEEQPSVKDQALADYQTRLKRLEQLKKRGLKAQRELKAGGGRRRSRKPSDFKLVGPEETSLPSAAPSPPGAPRMKQSDLHDGQSTTSYDRKL